MPFHYDHICNIKKCHALNKKIKKKKIDCWRPPLIICEKEKGNQIKKKVYTLDELFKIT